jgi:hypothetical protein
MHENKKGKCLSRSVANHVQNNNNAVGLPFCTSRCTTKIINASENLLMDHNNLVLIFSRAFTIKSKIHVYLLLLEFFFFRRRYHIVKRGEAGIHADDWNEVPCCRQLTCFKSETKTITSQLAALPYQEDRRGGGGKDPETRKPLLHPEASGDSDPLPADATQVKDDRQGTDEDSSGKERLSPSLKAEAAAGGKDQVADHSGDQGQGQGEEKDKDEVQGEVQGQGQPPPSQSVASASGVGPEGSATSTAVARVSAQCPICLDAIKDPKALSCAHVFCTLCINTSLQQKSQCPCCGTIQVGL